MSDSRQSLPDAETVVPPSRFLRLRTVALGMILFLAFLWIVLISVVIFAQWDILDHVERSLILIMLIVNTITVVMLPILLAQPFRPWLDAARALFLLLTHGGIALSFAIRSPSFKCLSPSGDLNQEALCTTTTVFVNVFDWGIPVLVVLYSGGLALYVHRQSKLQAKPISVDDAEKQVRKAHNSLQSNKSIDPSYEARNYAFAL